MKILSVIFEADLFHVQILPENGTHPIFVSVKHGRISKFFCTAAWRRYEIGYVRVGRGTYVVGDKTYDIVPGDVFLYSTNEPHCITNISSDEGMEIMSVKFEPRFIWAGGNDVFDSKFLRIFLDRNEKFENRLDRNNPALEEIRALMNKIEDEFLCVRPEYELMVKIYLLTVLAIANRSFGYVSEVKKPFSVHVRQLSQIERSIDYINAHYCEDLSLEEISESANMSKNYFCSLFKRLNGMSPWDYITVKRIELACSLLKSTQSSVTDISCECGFNNSANFNRAFRKVTGSSPRDYRNGE